MEEFADAQEESRDDRRPHEEGEESNSTTGECLLSASFPLTLTLPLDQSNELIPDVDQFGDDFNWDENFGGDFDDGEFGEFEDQSNVEEKRVDSQEPISGRSSKRGFDEIDSDTADEETPGDVSPSTFLSTPCVLSEAHAGSLQIPNGRRCCSLSLCWEDTVQAHVWPLHLFPSFHSQLLPPSTTDPRSSISPCSHHKHLLSSQVLRDEGALGMKSLLTFLGSDLWGDGLSFWVSDGLSKTTLMLWWIAYHVHLTLRALL